MAILSADLKERVERERTAHDEDDVLENSYRIKQRFSHIERYPSRLRYDERIRQYVGDVNGKTVLDFGCGRGIFSMEMLGNGAAKVCGIDISKVYIEDCQRKAQEAGYEEDRHDFRVMDAHQLEFPSQTFDLVVGFGILHHLDPELALNEIHRVLKPGGRVILQEPLADNPLLKLFRFLTPKARTADERPFTGKDIAKLTKRPGWQPEMVYCGVLEAPMAMLTSVLMPKRENNFLLRGADKIESWLHRTGRLLSWNQYVLFNLVKTRSDGATPQS
jgi:ubiquinone/menaquinone biosynthesis C-methylase UbiE